MNLTKTIYHITSQFPHSEQYGLASQMRRAAISIPSNLAEGATRAGYKEFLQFINITQGSLSELDTQLEISKMLGFISDETYERVLQELQIISEKLYGLANAIRNRQRK